MWDNLEEQLTPGFKEHIRYIRCNNSTSAYAAHIIKNIHEYGPKEKKHYSY
jgi:hypothetical protein